MKKQLVIFVLAVLLICVGLSGCFDNSGETKQPSTIYTTLGAPFRIDDFEITFTRIFYPSGEYCGMGDSDKISITIEITIKNAYGKRYSNFYIKAKEIEIEGGYFYSPGLGYDDIFSGLDPLKTKTGELIFCIPKGSTPIRAYFEHREYFGAEETPIELELT